MGGEPNGEDAVGAGSSARRARYAAFVVAAAGYMAATAAESLLAPLFPILRHELGLTLQSAGFAFGLLAASIAVGNLGGGFLLSRAGPRRGGALGMGVAAAGAAAAAMSGGRTSFLLAHVLLGLGSGAFFAPGFSAAARLASSRRRGLAIGFFGVAFSGGLALAALLAVAADAIGWRFAFWFAAGLSIVVAVAFAFVAIPPAGPRPLESLRPGLRRTFGLPLLVGGIASWTQYGTVAFMPAFAVTAWGVSPATAALMLAAARILSVPAKLLSGNAADQRGAVRIARRLGIFLALLGLWWTVVPGAAAAAWAAVTFAAFNSALGPVANLLAFEGFGQRGAMLGAFRSLQIAIGAAAGASIGILSGAVGLRPSLAVAAALPGVLFLARPGRDRHPADGAGRAVAGSSA